MAEVRFILTGFGPFEGAANNPTKLIVEEIGKFIASSCTHQEILSSSLHTLVIETSATDSRVQLDSIYNKIRQDDEGDCNYVVLHLGVNTSGLYFQLEKCAYNEASFRIPDQKEFQPKKEKIVTNERLGRRFNSSLNISSLCRAMNRNALPKDRLQTIVSTNPGRFVCNYTYCYSLHTIETKFGRDTCGCVCSPSSQDEFVASLFLHVPPVDVVCLSQQIEYVADLLLELRTMVQKRRQSRDGFILSMRY